MAKSLNPVNGFLDEGIVGSSLTAINFLVNDGGLGASQTRSMTTYELSDMIDEVIGTGASEAILAHGGDDKVNAGGGDDHIDGGAGNDQLYGGSGNDYILGGAGGDLIQGNDGDDVLDGGTGLDFLYGGTGNDLYRVFGQADVVTEYAGEGTDTVVTNLTTYTLGANLENLAASLGRSTVGVNYTGNGLNNQLSGGFGADTLNGGAGNDLLDGKGGADFMAGGRDNDTYRVDHRADSVVEAAGEGIDQVIASVDYTLGDHVEKLFFQNTAAAPTQAFTGHGNALDNTLVGGGGRDILNGMAGNDYLSGGGGIDLMVGGAGNDLYDVDHADELTYETADGGIDGVRTSLGQYTLQEHVENLDFVVTLGAGGPTRFHGIGNAGDNRLTGWSLGDTLEGGAGNDTLDGSGGADDMTGGTGHDLYIVDHAGDVVHESAGVDSGLDTVHTTLNSLQLAANVESMWFKGSGSFSGFGNDSANVIGGGAVNDSLHGGAGQDWLYGFDGNDFLNGGSGADSMRGGAGDDSYVVDHVGDNLLEYAGAGNDTVLTTLSSYTLPAEVEQLNFQNAINHTGYGNGLDNRLSGNAGLDTLYGGGGNDTVAGGLGNDQLDGGLGNDVLLGGNDNDKLTGSTGNDDLRGDAGNDTLWGGEGQDFLLGGQGADRFVFTTMDYGSMDRIGDFRSGQDKIDLSAFDAMPGTEGDQSLWYRGASDFIGGGQGSVRVDVMGPSETRIYVDVNGDSLSDLTIQMMDIVAPTPTVFDFVL